MRVSRARSVAPCVAAVELVEHLIALVLYTEHYGDGEDGGGDGGEN